MTENKNPYKVRCTQRIGNVSIFIIKTDRWLKNAGLNVESEGLIRVALSIRNYKVNIKNGSIMICRLCEQKNESIDYFISARLKNEERHVRIKKNHAHRKICKLWNIEIRKMM